MPGKRKSRLMELVEEEPQVEETVQEVEEPKEKVSISSVLDQDLIKLTEEQLMEIDYKVLLDICEEMGYHVPDEGKNTNKKLRTIILDNGGLVMPKYAENREEAVSRYEPTNKPYPITTDSTIEGVEPAEVTKATSSSSIYIEKSVTKNMGDYNSAKCTVGITLPVDHTKEELDKANEAITVALSLVDTRLEEEIDKLI